MAAAPDASALLNALGPLVDAMAARAPSLDRDEAFPSEDVTALKQAGAFTAPIPRRFGGFGAGTEPSGLPVLVQLLVAVGHGNLAVGRILEAHVNAVRLISEYGTERQQDAAAEDIRGGHVFGLWVTDPPGSALRLANGRLVGSKGPCSGAGHITRALVTVDTSGGSQMAIVLLDGSERVQPLRGVLHGMRAAANGTVHLDGVAVGPQALIGSPGDYLREPTLSTGAWRTSAVTLGGLDALVVATREQLNRRGRTGDVQQQDRFGRILIAQGTARQWVHQAAQRGEDPALPTAERVASVNLARIAIEAATLEAMQHVQRSLGLSAFIAPNPVERLLRDLAIYLRQPAPDAVLAEAAQHYFRA